jgi:hypothetical protein
VDLDLAAARVVRGAEPELELRRAVPASHGCVERDSRPVKTHSSSPASESVAPISGCSARASPAALTSPPVCASSQ